MRNACLAILAAALTPLPALAAGDAEEGGRIVTKWCSCVPRRGRHGPGAGSDAVPHFRTIIESADATKTPAYLRVFLSNPHEPTPDLSLTRQEIDDLIAYIERQRGR